MSVRALWIGGVALMLAGVGGLYLLAAQLAPSLPVPWEPESRWSGTPFPAVMLMLRMAEVGPGDRVADLGCGDGRVVIAAAHLGATGLCVDIDPAMLKRAQFEAAHQGVAHMITFKQGDLFDADLSGVNVVALFLWPEMNARLYPKLERELPPGSRVVSHWHPIPGVEPDAQIEMTFHRRTRPLFLWESAWR